jgi:hypothetical protein
MAFLGRGIGFYPLIRWCRQNIFIKLQMMVRFVNARRDMIAAEGPGLITKGSRKKRLIGATLMLKIGVASN